MLFLSLSKRIPKGPLINKTMFGQLKGQLFIGKCVIPNRRPQFPFTILTIFSSTPSLPGPAADAVTAAYDGRHDDLGFCLQQQAVARDGKRPGGKGGKAVSWIGMSKNTAFFLTGKSSTSQRNRVFDGYDNGPILESSF